RPGSDRAGRWLYGRHAVAAALANPERVWRRLIVLAGEEAEAEARLATAPRPPRGAGAPPPPAGAARAGGGGGGGEPLRALDRAALEALLPGGAVHQGWALEVEPL